MHSDRSTAMLSTWNLKRVSMRLATNILLCSQSSMAVEHHEMRPSPGALKVRFANLDDIPRIKHCNIENLPENYPDSFFQCHIESWPELSLIAEDVDNGGLAGYALGRVEMGTLSNALKVQWVPGQSHSAPKYVGHVTSIAVDSEYRGRGIASTLMDKLHVQMKKVHDVSKVTLHCRVTNKAAIGLYRDKLSYSCVKKVPNYYADGEEAWIMELPTADIIVEKDNTEELLSTK